MCKCDLNDRLVAEQFDISYRKKREVVPPLIKTKIVRMRPRFSVDERDSLFYNAGRYAAGHRDSAAEKSHEELQNLFEDIA
jgi:hypothetical protein